MFPTFSRKVGQLVAQLVFQNLITSTEEVVELCHDAGGPASKDDKVTFQELVKGGSGIGCWKVWNAIL